MPENAEEGLLVHCDSCNKWVHCKCYSLDEQTIGRDRFGGLHPITALQLYTSIALPRMLYGAEIWCITNTELKMFERAHRRILRTIQGLPIRCPKESIGTLLGCSTISDLITYKKLSFLISNAALLLLLYQDKCSNVDSKNLSRKPGSPCLKLRLTT